MNTEFKCGHCDGGRYKRWYDRLGITHSNLGDYYQTKGYVDQVGKLAGDLYDLMEEVEEGPADDEEVEARAKRIEDDAATLIREIRVHLGLPEEEDDEDDEA